CQILACNFTAIAWVALTFCSLERLASTRIPDQYDRRFRSQEATVLALSLFIPLGVACILLQYLKVPDLVFAIEMAALISFNILLLIFHFCTESRLRSLPQTISRKFQVRQNIRMGIDINH
ncbi:hypothetical protein PMAYCL1PPCAC_12934, partial [Pristionchus mayeri]